MAGLSRQLVGSDIGSLISVLLFLFFVLVVYWFYDLLSQMEKTLLEIKRLLEAKT